MSSLSQSIITNVDPGYIETYLKTKGMVRTEDEAGQDLKYWVDNLLSTGQINIEEFEEFLLSELFYGKRKTVRVYKLDGTKNYKYPSDWELVLEEKYGVSSINFCNILHAIPNKEELRKIAAISAEENDKGELTRIQLLFACFIQLNDDAGRGYTDSIAYIPVEIDFIKEILLIKAWTRQKIALEEHKSGNLMIAIKNLMEEDFKVVTKGYMAKHKKVLFHMSKRLINEAYTHIPTYSDIDGLNEIIQRFISETIQGLALKNVEVDKDGKYHLLDGVLDYEAEIKNVLKSLVISDHFFDKDFDEIWRMGLEAVVARVKFNDDERVLTSLSGENTSTPIFCTKTFMSLKNRMEETEKLETLWIAMRRKRGNLNLKFDASDSEYLEILIKYGIRFGEADMILALAIYEKYETILNQSIAKANKIAVNQ